MDLDSSQQRADAPAPAAATPASGGDAGALVEVEQLMDVLRASDANLQLAQKYGIAEKVLDHVTRHASSQALAHAARAAFTDGPLHSSWLFDKGAARAKVKVGDGSRETKCLEWECFGFLAVFLGRELQARGVTTASMATLLQPLRSRFVEAVKKEIDSAQRKIIKLRTSKTPLSDELPLAAQAVDTEVFGPELERLLEGMAGDPNILHKAVKVLMGWRSVRDMMVAGGACRVAQEFAPGSMEWWAERPGRIGRRDLKARIAVFPAMHLAAIASSVNCPKYLLWRGLVEVAQGRTSTEIDKMAELRVCAHRKLIGEFERDYARMSSVSAALWARKIIRDGGYVANLVDNASSTVLGKFQGGDKSTAALIHYSVQVLCGADVNNAFPGVTHQKPRWICVTDGLYFGHAFPEKLSRAASTSALELRLPAVVSEDDPVVLRSDGGLSQNNSVKVHFENDLDLTFVELSTMGRLMETMPQLGVPSDKVALWVNLTRKQLDPSGIVWTDDDEDLSSRASTRDAARALLFYSLADALKRVANLKLLPGGLKFANMPTLDTLMTTSIDIVNPFHKQRTKTRVLPASPHNELTTRGSTRILTELLPRQGPYKYGDPDLQRKLKDQLTQLERQVSEIGQERRERLDQRASARLQNLQRARDELARKLGAASPRPAATPGPARRSSPRTSPRPRSARIAGRPATPATPAPPLPLLPQYEELQKLVDENVLTQEDVTKYLADVQGEILEAVDEDPQKRPLEVLLESLDHTVRTYRRPTNTKGESMACSDGLTVARFVSAVTKFRDMMLQKSCNGLNEGKILCDTFSLLLSLAVIEHDRLHGVFHVLHLALNHDFDHQGRALLQLRNLNKVGPTSAEAGQQVRKKLHHEHIRLVGTVLAVLEAMLADDEYASYVEDLERDDDGAVSASDFLEVFVDYLKVDEGGADFSATRDHVLLASLLRAFKLSLQHRHWPMTVVAEMALSEAMIAHGKKNYGNFHIEVPYKLLHRSLAQTLVFYCCVMTTTERDGMAKAGMPSGDVHEKLVLLSGQRMSRRDWGHSIRASEGRDATARAPGGSVERDREKMEIDTAASALCAAVLSSYEDAVELTRPRRDDWGGVGIKNDVKRVAAALRQVEACAHRPTRTARVSMLVMLQMGRTISLTGDEVSLFLETARLSISEAPATRGMPCFNAEALELAFVDLDEDDVLVAYATGDDVRDFVASSRNVDVRRIDKLYEPSEIFDDEDEAPLNYLAQRRIVIDPRPDVLRLRVFSPSSARHHVPRDIIHVEVHGAGTTRLSDKERLIRTALAVETSDAADRLEDDVDASGPPRDALAGTPLAGRAKLPTALPKPLLALRKLLDDGTDPLDDSHVTKRGIKRMRPDARLREAMELLLEGPAAVVPLLWRDRDEAPAEEVVDARDEALVAEIDELLLKQDAVSRDHEKVLDEKGVFVTKQDVRTLVGGRQQLEALDRKAAALLKERERLGREITELRRKRNARDDEPAAGSSDDEDDPGAASEDDDRPDVQPDIEKVFSDDDDSLGDFDP